MTARAEKEEFATPVDAIVARLLSLHPRRNDLSLDAAGTASRGGSNGRRGK